MTETQAARSGTHIGVITAAAALNTSMFSGGGANSYFSIISDKITCILSILKEVLTNPYTLIMNGALRKSPSIFDESMVLIFTVENNCLPDATTFPTAECKSR